MIQPRTFTVTLDRYQANASQMGPQTRNQSLNCLTLSGNSEKIPEIRPKFWESDPKFRKCGPRPYPNPQKIHRWGGVRIFWGGVCIFTGRCMFSIQITGGYTCLIQYTDTKVSRWYISSPSGVYTGVDFDCCVRAYYY